MRTSLIGGVLAAALGVARPLNGQLPQPSVSYALRVDSANLSIADVTIRIEHVPSTLRLAMKVHPEYDAKYWRYFDPPRVDGTSDDRNARVVRSDSTVWRATLPGGYGSVHYRIHLQGSPSSPRRAWQSFMRPTGGLVNSPDFFLYLPDFDSARVSVSLDVPRSWRIATSLEPTTTPTRFTAPYAATLLDAPILLGDVHEWSFADRGTRFHVVYWPLPDATPFDTVAFVDEVRRLTGAALDVFGHAPTREFYFLLQDGAGDALEHRASVTLGIRSAALAVNPRASLAELAHEFFHTWNLVAIHPDSYGELSYQPPARTAGLWWGEGVTIYCADALIRRAGLSDPRASRLDHLGQLLTSYYAAPSNGQVSPERASLAFGDSPVDNPDATGGYYQQGELLGLELDALLRDSTQGVRNLDDVMRALFAQSNSGEGFTSSGLERVADSVCGCRLDAVFSGQVRGASLVDAATIVAPLGMRVTVDSAQAVDSAGNALPDLRVGMTFAQTGGPPRLVVRNPATIWSRSGLRTGDVLVAMNGGPIATFADLQRTLRGLQVGDTVAVDVRRDDVPMRVTVPVSGYVAPRVRFVDVLNATAAQRSRRVRWLSGW